MTTPRQLKHKHWLSSTTLHNPDGTPIDQRNRWDIQSAVKFDLKFREGPGQYHTFTVAYFFWFEDEMVEVDEKTYWSARIGDWLEM